MNLLLCSMSVPWPTRPSQGAYHISQAKALIAKGCHTTVFSPAPLIPLWCRWFGEPLRRHIDRPESYKVQDVQVFSPRLPFAFPRFARKHLATACPQLLSYFSSLALRKSVLDACRSLRIDRILAHGLLPWGQACTQAANELGLDLCFIEHSAEDVLRLRRGTSLGEHYRQIALNAGRILVVGEPMHSHLVNHLGLDNVNWIPNGVDFQMNTLGAKEPRECAVLAAGHYYRRKRFEELVESWPAVIQHHPNARLVIVTNAPESLRTLIQQSGVAHAITLHPLVSAPQLRRMMSEVTLFALPSVAEAFGLVYAEALSEGTPVLMSEDCGLASLVASPTTPLGWVADSRDRDSLRNTLILALHNPKECHARGLVGARIVRDRFTWEANANAVLNSFSRVGSHR